MKPLKFYILLIFVHLPIFVYAESFNPVFNDGYSKMEMIEKMDQYLSKELPLELKNQSNRVESIHQKLSDNLLKIHNRIDIIEQRLKELQESVEKVSLNQRKSSNGAPGVSYLKDLENVIIPAIQKSVLQNKRELQEFIKNVMAERETKKIIEKELKDE